jgi:hypothetical protein
MSQSPHERKKNLPPAHINNVQIPHEDVKYLGMHLDRRLAWRKHIFAKMKTAKSAHQSVLVTLTQVKFLHRQ